MHVFLTHFVSKTIFHHKCFNTVFHKLEKCVEVRVKNMLEKVGLKGQLYFLRVGLTGQLINLRV